MTSYSPIPMPTITQTYLGNTIANSDLAAQVEQCRRQNTCLDVYLSQQDSRKGRIHAHATSGEAIGIIKQRDRPLQEGDVFQTESGKWLIVHLEVQRVMVLSFTGEAPGHELDLIHLGHVLGNHHWAIVMKPHCIYVELTTDPEVIETTIQHFKIPNLSIQYESRSPHQFLNFSHHSHH